MKDKTLCDKKRHRIKDEQDDLLVGVSSFPVTGEIQRNTRYILRHIRKTALRGADVILFPEGAASGYGRSQIALDDYDWDALRLAIDQIRESAKEHKVWVFLGSVHYLSPRESPTNCLYIISPEGAVADRYDKRMLFGHEIERYSAGAHPVTLDVKGWRCGFLICYDSNFPELFNLYRHMGVQVLFLAMNGGGCQQVTPHVQLLSELTLAQCRTRAIDNRMWLVVSNSSLRNSTAPSMMIRPDGSYRRTRLNRSGLLCHRLPDGDLGMLYNDKPMKLAENEVYHNGTVSSHSRALDRKTLP